MNIVRALFLVLFLSSVAAAGGGPLSFNSNWFLTGDYTVGGVGLRGTGSGGVATGNICIAGVPSNADIIAAFLYWETIGDGHNGSFEPYGATTPSNVLGTALGTSPSSNSMPAITVYRADVLQFFPRDTNGHQLVNTSASPCPKPPSTSPGHVITLPDSGQQTTVPSTLGASLLIVWRLPGMGIPYKAIVLYDGAFTLPSSGLLFNQTLLGFYQASSVSPQATMTQIVGGAEPPSNTDPDLTVVSVNGSLYVNPFAASAGPSWDNFTVPVTVAGNASRVATAAATFDDRLTWAAVVFSTTVQDTDGDGIPDIVESQGMVDPSDGSFVNFPAMGADPKVKDVFVQLDWMVAADHNHQPKQEALNRVIAAFANAPGGPIHVHFDIGQGGPFTGGGHNIPEVTTTAWKKDFNSIKATYFARNRRNFWHYGLLAHEQPPFNQPPLVGVPNTSSGISDLPGGDFMITFGGWTPRGDPADNMVGTVDEQTGTIMHEIGHNFFLKHGGATLTPNCKPNFESVMNYDFQTQGLVDNNGVIHWDYSREKLPDLTEATLDEQAGLGTMLYRTRWFAPPNFLDIMLDDGSGALIKPFGCKGTLSPLSSGVTRKESSGTSGPIDWDNALTASPLPPFFIPFIVPEPGTAAVDSDGNGVVETSAYSGFNDWLAADYRQINGRVNQANGELANGELANGELQADGELANGVGEYNFDEAGKQIPAAPTGLTATTSTGQVSLTWTAIPLKIITSYAIYRLDATHPQGTKIGQATGSPPSASFTDTSVTAGTVYSYFVTDIDHFGNQSSYSNVVMVTAQ